MSLQVALAPTPAVLPLRNLNLSVVQAAGVVPQMWEEPLLRGPLLQRAQTRVELVEILPLLPQQQLRPMGVQRPVVVEEVAVMEADWASRASLLASQRAGAVNPGLLELVHGPQMFSWASIYRFLCPPASISILPTIFLFYLLRTL
ncbi:hypothetical protein DL93DRAFT_477739 [Clavulina sp. PMI_390]|nr:hypothetical protein DL93DRAFT_477739 [Clavulina sp. PMI_390]